MASLTQKLSADVIEEVLERAGETRGLEELGNMGSWSSYGQFKRLLQEAARSLDSSLNIGSDLASIKYVDFDMAESIRALGSPEAVLSSGGDSPLIPIRRYQMTEIRPHEWTCREGFIEGFAPYPEFCDLVAGLYGAIPVYFGLPAADVIEEECQCRGDATCLFRVRWEQIDPETARANALVVHAELLEGRLGQLHAMITDLASNERHEDVLQGIVGSSLRAAGAAGAVLALKAREGSPSKVYSEGLSASEAALVADELLAGAAVRSGVVSVEVASARRHYGVLAIDERGGLFASHSHGTLQAYGQLAAAALDAADAMEDARHQANTARVLLELSTSLAEITSTEEMASKVARAVPDVIDCDRVAVFLEDTTATATGDGDFQLAGCYGYPAEAVALLSVRSFREWPSDSVLANGLERSLVSDVGTAASVSAPITSAGKVIGAIVVGVTSHPERLSITKRLTDRLKGLAAQASIAIINARLVDQIRFQGLHDMLTGLPNRGLILDRTEQMLARARRNNVPVAALFIDLDGFKHVNDTLGHASGDQLLQEVTDRLLVTMRESDSIGRLGGDEFIVLVDGSTMDAGPELVAERLLGVLRDPFVLEGSSCGPLTITASIGIATGVRPSATELLRDADIALYEAKSAGKDCFVVFRPKMHTVVQDRLLLEMDLRDALRRQQYYLVYQPIFSLRSGATTGVEALLRWRHPERGVAQPDTFISILEESGMILDVGRWVLEEATRQGAYWHALGLRLDVSVNVSARQLESDQFIEDVQVALADSGFDARSLIVEITETAIMRNVEAVVPRLAAIRAIGVRVAIDDFGTGYSSLGYLKQFPVDTIKIDRSFVASMADSSESAALIRTLVELGRTLGLETLAEGIEESSQYSQLERAHCDSGQGYFYARPLAAEAVEEFLAGQSEIGGPASGSIGRAHDRADWVATHRSAPSGFGGVEPPSARAPASS